MDKRCDGKLDCPDRTDEDECLSFVTFKGYNSHLVPPPIKIENNTDSRLIMTFSISIVDILEINEFEGFFMMKMTFTREWYNPQLTFLNLKRDSRMNVLSTAEVSRMWKPWTVFDNLKVQQDYHDTEFIDITVVVPNENYTYNYDEQTNRRITRLFSGSENKLSYTRQCSVKFICNFDLRFYPFDKQTCHLEMYQAEDSILLKPGHAEYLGPTELQNHYVFSVFLCTDTTKKRNTLLAGIMIGRPLFTNVLTVFLPTLILLVLSQMAHLFHQDHLEMVIEINLTLLLVLATL